MLYKRHGDTVFRYAWHLLGRREDAEDATQATFLAVHGALSGGTAVLESGAWVLRIARNECMGRLRQTARRPAVRSLDDGFEPPAVGGVERTAELRDEVRTTQKTLAGLPVPEREAFVLREWLGFESSEAALALGMTAGEVDGLATRARRSLVIAVGGLEPAISCSGTRAALEAGSLDRAREGPSAALPRLPGRQACAAAARGVRAGRGGPAAFGRHPGLRHGRRRDRRRAHGEGGNGSRAGEDGGDRRRGSRDGRRRGAGDRARAARAPREGARRAGAGSAGACGDAPAGQSQCVGGACDATAGHARLGGGSLRDDARGGRHADERARRSRRRR